MSPSLTSAGRQEKIAGKEKNLKAILILENIQPHSEGQKLHLTTSRIQGHKGTILAEGKKKR